MSVSEFANSTPGETFALISARRKREDDQMIFENYKLKINRLNSYYNLKSAGSKLNNPEELYFLNGDEDIIPDNPFSEENNKLFENMK